MKKTIFVYTRFDRRHVWEDSHAYTEKADAVSAARHQLDYLTSRERKDNDLYVTGYEIDLEDGDTRTAETIYSDLLDDDRLCDLHQISYEEIKEDIAMKKSEVITANYDAILETMIDRYAKVIGAAGRVQYDIYIWEDGEIECLELPQGDNSYLRPYDNETRELYFITTVSEPFYDPRDQIADKLPEDEKEQEALFAEVDDWMVDQYKLTAAERLDTIIDDAELMERCDP